MSAASEDEVLILVPTPLELNLLQTHFPSQPGVAFAPCGFGPTGAANTTQYLIQRHQPKRIILAGIVGHSLKTCNLGVAIPTNRC